MQKLLVAHSRSPAPRIGSSGPTVSRLSTEKAQTAWLNAVSWSQQGYVPARLVELAAKQVLRSERRGVQNTAADGDRKQRSHLRQSARQGFQELLQLLLKLNGEERDVLIAKVQALQRLLDGILTRSKNKL